MNLYERQLIKKIDEGFRCGEFFERIIEHSKQKDPKAGGVKITPELLDWFLDVAHEWYIQGVIVGMTIDGEIEDGKKSDA